MGDNDRIEVKIAQIAARQQRNVTREQLLAIGMPSTSVTRWLKIGRLYRVHPGVYAVGCPPITPLERAMAAVIACAPQMNTSVCGYEVDALFATQRVIVELDGWQYHSSRASFERDRKRDADTLAAGFATVRLTAERYEHNPAREAAQLHEILARRMAP